MQEHFDLAVEPEESAVLYIYDTVGNVLDDPAYSIHEVKKRLSKSLLIGREFMPVLPIDRLKEIQDYLSELSIKYRVGFVSARKLKPSQKNLYLDNSLGKIKKFGVADQINYLKTKGLLVISSDGYILDGHHRWLIAMLINPNMRIKVFQVGLSFSEVYSGLKRYSEWMGEVAKD